MSAPSPSVRPLTDKMRGLLLVFGVLTILAVGVLYILAEHTDRYFAWTVSPPITAAFLGGGFGAGFVLVVLTRRERAWANARVGVLTILLFVMLTLLATLLHLDRFHFGAPGAVARFAAWFWLVIYVLVPLAMLALLAVQVRVPGSDPPRQRALPSWLAWLIGLQGTVMAMTGAGLFVAPKAVGTVWPWVLTPLTGRAVGAWLIALGVAAALAIRERDLARLRAAAVTYAVFGALQLGGLARFAEHVRWGAAAWLYTVMVASVLAAGLYGWAAANRGSRNGRETAHAGASQTDR
ncbi:MAG: hypothetical protein ACRDZ4_22610 [Egibacteraceae bacterium]